MRNCVFCVWAFYFDAPCMIMFEISGLEFRKCYSSWNGHSRSSYRPITISTIIEKLTLGLRGGLTWCRQEILTSFSLDIGLLSRIFDWDSTIGLLKVISDAITPACNRLTTDLLSLLDFSAAFYTIDHAQIISLVISASVVASSAGCDLLLLTGTNTIDAKQSVSTRHGVPHGSVLGPLLFAMYISPVSNVVAAYNLSYLIYNWLFVCVSVCACVCLSTGLCPE